MKHLLTALVFTSAALFGGSAFAGGSEVGNGYAAESKKTISGIAQSIEDYAKCIGNNPVKYCVAKSD